MSQPHLHLHPLLIFDSSRSQRQSIPCSFCYNVDSYLHYPDKGLQRLYPVIYSLIRWPFTNIILAMRQYKYSHAYPNRSRRYMDFTVMVMYSSIHKDSTLMFTTLMDSQPYSFNPVNLFKHILHLKLFSSSVLDKNPSKSKWTRFAVTNFYSFLKKSNPPNVTDLSHLE